MGTPGRAAALAIVAAVPIGVAVGLDHRDAADATTHRAVVRHTVAQAAPAVPTRRRPEAARPRARAAVQVVWPRLIPPGTPLGMLTIPRLDESVPFRQGVDAVELQYGPGHYPTTKLPGQLGTVALAGHRTTHTRPFLRLNLLRRGDAIVVHARGRSFRYRVYAMRIVRPTDVWVLMPRGTVPRLVLTACHPPHRADRRIVVFARQVSPAPPT